MKHSPGAPNFEENTSAGESSPSQSSSQRSVLEKLADKYNDRERSRIDEARKKINESVGDPQLVFHGEKIDTTPSTLRKIGRLAMDCLGIHSAKSEKRRNGEAMSLALNEYSDQIRKDQEENERLTREAQEREEKRKQEYKKREKESLERDLIRGMDLHRAKKHERFKKQRAQEILEKDLNSRLLTIDTLEDEISGGNPEVEKTQKEYEGKIIPVYTLKGLPFSMLSHDVEYRKANLGSPYTIGTETFQKIVEDPSVWAQRESEASKEEGFGTTGSKARGNVIFTSYIDSESNLDQRVGSDKGDLCYGFSHIDGGDLLKVSQSDGGTPNMVSKDIETFISEHDISFLDMVEGPSGRAGYNEVVFRRYTENGEPHLPDYIITENGHIAEKMLKHAAFFKIPIVNIDKAPYYAKAENIATEALDTIDENSSYEEISDVIDEIKRTPKYNNSISPVEIIGDGSDILIFEYKQGRLGDEISKKIYNLEKLEREKRIDFIAQELQKAIEQCKQATAKKERYEFSSEKIELISCDFCDNRNGVRYTNYGRDDNLTVSPASSNEINFNFRFKNSTRIINTTVRNGKDKVASSAYEQELIEKSDNSFFNKIHPLIMEFFAALEENRSINQ